MTDSLPDRLTDTARLARLRLLDATGAGEDENLRRIVRTAARLADAPYAAIHVLDDGLQHRVAAVGAPVGTHPVADSLCRLVVTTDDPVAIADVRSDARTAYSTFATGPDGVGFYAAAPLRTPVGPIGTLCVWSADARGNPTDILDSLTDLADLVAATFEARMASRALAADSATDPLTGVANRRIFDEHLERLLHGYRRAAGSPPAVAVLDLDGFKAVNDILGHAVGDRVLVEVAARLAGSIRGDELLVRLGGDEFAVIGGPDLTEPSATARFRHAVAEVMAPIPDSAPMSVSIGVAVATPSDTVAGLLERADRAMYSDKRAA